MYIRSGGKKASTCRRNSRSARASGWPTAPVCANGLSGPTLCGRMTSWPIGRRTVGPFGLSLCSARTRLVSGLDGGPTDPFPGCCVDPGGSVPESRIPAHIRSDNGPKFIAIQLRPWLKHLNVAPLSSEPGSPWENGYVESFNDTMREPFLNGELFHTLKEAQILTERWRIHFYRVRPHRSLVGLPPAPETIQFAS